MSQYNYKFIENIKTFALDFCNELLKDNRQPVFMCLGSSKVIADSLGPITGTLLTQKYNIKAFVYGNIKNNITGENLEEYYEFIKQTHPKSKIIIIDSGLGDINDVGLIKLNKGKLYSKALETSNKYGNKGMGDYNILGIINTIGINNLLFLKSIKLDTCINMANFIAASLDYSFKAFSNIKQIVM